MPKWVRPGVFNDGLNDIKTNVVKMVLVSAYAAGDSAATIQGNKLAEVVMTSADLTLSSVGLARRLTTATKSGSIAVTDGAPDDLHVAFLDVTNEPIWVTDETTDMAVTIGNPVDFPAATLTFNQPT